MLPEFLSFSIFDVIFILNKQLRSLHSYGVTLKNGTLKSALFLHADTLLLNYVLTLYDKSLQQPSPTENTVRRAYVHATLDDYVKGEVVCPEF